jgi:phosphoserine phosphatase RsbU/P
MPENAVIVGAKKPDTVLPPKSPDAPPAPVAIPTALPEDGLRSFVSHQLAVTGDTPLESMQKFFGTHDLEFVAVVEKGRVIGLCARRQIGIVLGSRYGFSLFSRNPVRDYLVPQALVIRTTDPIHQVLDRVSSRRDEFFYDDVLLEDENSAFLGSIFVRNLVRLQHGLMLKNIEELERNRVEIERKNGQMEQELTLAGKVQLAMLPQIYPAFPPQSLIESSILQFHHRYIPAGKVSGDFFHISRISDHQAGVFICDVMGHGVRSAMITSMLRALVEELQCDAEEPSQLLESLNEDLFAMLRQNDETMYASAIYLVINTANLRVRWAAAGHPSPLYLRACDSAVELLPLPREKRGKVLGLVSSSTYETSEVTLQSDDRLLLYTDGIYEIFSGDQEFGVNGVTATLQQNFALPTPHLLDKLMQTARTFSPAPDFEDDVCLVAVDVTLGKA